MKLYLREKPRQAAVFNDDTDTTAYVEVGFEPAAKMAAKDLREAAKARKIELPPNAKLETLEALMIEAIQGRK